MTNSSAPRLTRKAEAAHHAEFKNEREAWELLKLIDAEFRSDPMSVQCFDLRVVERVRQCVASHETFQREYGFFQ